MRKSFVAFYNLTMLEKSSINKETIPKLLRNNEKNTEKLDNECGSEEVISPMPILTAEFNSDTIDNSSKSISKFYFIFL